MSQLTKTVFKSCGLTVGWNIAPPPPGPMTLKLPGRASPKPLSNKSNPKNARRKKSAISFLCFPCDYLRFLSWQKLPEMSILKKLPSHVDPQKLRGVLVIDFLEDFILQSQAINSPAPLRRHLRRRVVEILVFGFQEPVIDFVQQVGEDLLRRVRPVRNGVRSKQKSILIFFKELSGHARLAAKLSYAGAHLPVHVGKTIHTFAHVGKVFCVVAYVKHDELRLGMTLQHTVACFQQFRVTRKIFPME